IAGDKLTLNSVVVTGNTLHVGDGTNGDSVTPATGGLFARGGGIYATGDLSLTDCTVSDNIARAGKGGTALAGNGTGGNALGGGIYCAANLTMVNTDVSNNEADAG